MLQPQNEELEQTILGACLLEITAMNIVGDWLRAEMFYFNKHQIVYTAMHAMHDAGKKIDLLTVAQELRQLGKLEEAGGPFYITQLCSHVTSSAHLEYHARILYQQYIRRETIQSLGKILAAAADETIDIADTLTDIHQMLDKLEKECKFNHQLRNMQQLMNATLTEAKGRKEKSNNGVTGIPTGLTDLNRLTSGWQNGNLYIEAARPSAGKTALAMHFALTASQAGYHTVVYSLEMQGERLGDRLLLAKSNINPQQWNSGQLSDTDFETAGITSAELSRLPLYIDDSTDIGMDSLRSNARMLKSKGKCDFIIIDYLQLCNMRTEQANRNREQEVAQATRKAKLLAKELNIPILLLSQLNRMSENAPGQRPELSHLRESGAIEQDADMVMLLYRPAMARIPTEKESGYPTEGLGMIIIAKHRNGETGNIYFGHNRSLTKIADYVPPMQWMMAHAK